MKDKPQEERRLERLVRAGQLSADEARELASCSEQLHQRESALAPPTGPGRWRTQASRAKLALLRGELSAETYRDLQRRLATRMGMGFGVWMGLVVPLAMHFSSGPRSLGASIATGVFLAILGGPAFGVSMYALLLRPSAERLIRLAEGVRAAGGDACPTQAPSGPTPAGRCPTCAAENKSDWGPRHPVMLHWVLNPALAFNELVLGQRIPRHMSGCKECGTYWIDCGPCESAFDSAEWSAADGLGRWRGLRCPRCSQEVPCLRNAFALFVSWPFTRRGRHIRARTRAEV